MSATIRLYNPFFLNTGEAKFDFTSATLKVALLTSAYTPNYNTDTTYADLTNEVVGAGYTAGGATIGSPAWTQDNTNNRAVLSGDDVSWVFSTITARYGAIYKFTGTPSTSYLIGLIDFGTDVSTSVGEFLITWNASGILAI